MTARIFPNVELLLTILMGELPENVYPDDRADDPDPDLRSYSSSELRAVSQMMANLYANLDEINDNKFITTMRPSGVAQWEVDLFGTPQDASLPFQSRQQNLLSKIRASGGISLSAISNIVAGFLTQLGIPFAIAPWDGANNGSFWGAWILGYSQLGLDTFLGLRDPLWGCQQDFTPLDCSLDYAAAGLTLTQLQEIQTTAYTYEVQIYGNADPTTLNLLNLRLTELEAAYGTHVIRNNSPGPVPPT